jgi:hypothetical protein
VTAQIGGILPLPLTKALTFLRRGLSRGGRGDRSGKVRSQVGENTLTKAPEALRLGGNAAMHASMARPWSILDSSLGGFGQTQPALLSHKQFTRVPAECAENRAS